MVDCLVGLQWGSEGKGKIAAYLSKEYNAMVRSGGPQAGHSFFVGKNKYVNRQVPCGIHNPYCKLYIAPAAIINMDVLLEEIENYQLSPEQLMVDNNASILTEKHIKLEEESQLEKRLASTLEGVGAAQSEKVWRRSKLFGNDGTSNRECLYDEHPELYFYAGDVPEALYSHNESNEPILLEGTQGFGLSLNHGDYPFVTSRDIINSTLLSDSGLSPKIHGQTIGVLRTYPIRVGGNSGPTGSEELTFEEIAKRSGSKKTIAEYTTVTRRKRRIFEQSWGILSKAIEVNQPDQIALTFLDYINHEDYGKNDFDNLSQKSKDYIKLVEDLLFTPVTLISTGPKNEHMIDIRYIDRKRIPSKDICYHNYNWDFEEVAEFVERKMGIKSLFSDFQFDRHGMII